MIMIRCKKLPFNVNDICLFPFVFIVNKFTLEGANHKAIHFQQQKELGLIFFLLLYGIEYLIRLIQYRDHWRAYYNISFENEAYTNQANLDYLKERKFWDWLKYYGKS